MTGCASWRPRPWSISIARSPTAWFGPVAGLRLVDEIADADALRDYAPLPAARGDFLFRAGRLAEARSEFKAATTLTRNARERAFVLARSDACDCKP
jgi:predicted RNA polymerase sigma factor